MGFVENCRKSEISFGKKKKLTKKIIIIIACWLQAVEEEQLEFHHTTASLLVVLFWFSWLRYTVPVSRFYALSSVDFMLPQCLYTILMLYINLRQCHKGFDYELI